MAKMIYRILEIMPFGTNCYLVASESSKDGMVIDPAGDATRILKNNQELGLYIRLVVATHAHPDHVGAAKQVLESTGAMFAAHPSDADIIKRYDLSRFMGGPQSFFTQPPVPDKLLSDGDYTEIGDLSFQVLHIPGHSPGSICLAGQGVVFTGDVLFNMGIGRTDFPNGDHNLLISGIHNKLMVLPDQTVVLPGHGPKTSIGQERRENPFLR